MYNHGLVIWNEANDDDGNYTTSSYIAGYYLDVKKGNGTGRRKRKKGERGGRLEIIACVSEYFEKKNGGRGLAGERQRDKTQ